MGSDGAPPVSSDSPLRHRGVLSTALISFFFGAFSGFLWIGRGRLAVVFLAASVAALIAGFLAVLGGVIPLEGWFERAYVDVLLIGVAVASTLLVILSRKPMPVRRYSSGWTVVPAFLAYFAVLGISAILVRTFIFQPFSVPAGGMSPTLAEGDYMAVSKWVYGYGRYSAPFGLLPVDGRTSSEPPQRGDIVVFRHPSQPGFDYVKRIVGLPGDRIQMIGGILNIDGNPVSRDHTRDVQDTLATGTDEAVAIYRETLPNGVTYDTFDGGADGPLDDTAEQTVPEGTYFVLGDNRDNSADNRVWGTVPEGNLIGRVERIYWNARGLPFAARSASLVQAD